MRRPKRFFGRTSKKEAFRQEEKSQVRAPRGIRECGGAARGPVIFLWFSFFFPANKFFFIYF
ncbi:hypothetical protein BDV38DRAFT_262762, partial [Aspergillus pseudotamarii]